MADVNPADERYYDNGFTEVTIAELRKKQAQVKVEQAEADSKN